MKIAVWFIAAIILIYVLNLLVCTVYCKAKKRMDTQKNSGDSANGHEASPGKIVACIKQLLAGWIRYSVIRLGRVPCHLYRNWILRHIYQMDISQNAVIYGGFEIRAPWNITVGEGTVIGDDSKLDGRNGIVIGKNVNMSTGVWIWTEQHDVNDAFFASNDSGGQVTVGDRAWLSARTIVLPKVSVGEGSILAAGAVAVKDLEPFGIYGGIPAKKIGERSQNLKYEFDGAHLPFY